MFSKFIRCLGFCFIFSTYLLHGQEQSSYSIAAPDNSVVLSADRYGVTKLAINGSWNRFKENLVISDRANTFRFFDFGFGTYTDLINTTNKLSYSINAVSNQIILKTSRPSLNLTRTILLLSNGSIVQTISLSNTSAQDLVLDNQGLAFTMASLADIANINQNNNNILEYKYFDGKKLKKAKISSGSFFGGPQPMDFIKSAEWISVADNFFLFIVQPNILDTVTIYHGLEFGKSAKINIGTQVLATNIAPNQSLDVQMNYYIGPRSEKIAVASNPEFKKLFAWPVVFNWILKPIESGTNWILTSLNSLIGSPGITLILIAILVKLLLLPLSIKSAISMKKMRMLQPKLNKLQEKFGYDPQLLQQKTLELYKSEKANPLGGCLPLLLQIPVFFALFRVLSRSVDLRGAQFLWIKDLTMPDSLFMIGSFSFNLLPVLMTLLQLVSVFLQQGRVGDSQNNMQKQMQIQSYFMPVIFLFLFWNMPSGLVVYWTVQNIFSIIEQEAINLDSRFGKKSL
ncbi:MAG: YidC/Oxa1 family insertase periplasmic-domain containing protein [Brevinema sp.]